MRDTETMMRLDAATFKRLPGVEKKAFYKIMAHPYRKRCRRHLLRMSLICGIINHEAT